MGLAFRDHRVSGLRIIAFRAIDLTFRIQGLPVVVEEIVGISGQ